MDAILKKSEEKIKEKGLAGLMSLEEFEEHMKEKFGKIQLPDWQVQLQEDFPFMKGNVDNINNTYQFWGAQCSGGWYPLLRECCEAIVARYAEDGIEAQDIDFVPAQIKEKFGTLRFYFGYKDTPCRIAAFDSLGSGTSLRFEPGSENDDDKTKKLRHDIAQIVRAAEEKSKYTCEMCGAPGILRNDSDAGVFRVQTLCDSCCERRIILAQEARRKRREKLKAIYEEINKKQSNEQSP